MASESENISSQVEILQKMKNLLESVAKTRSANIESLSREVELSRELVNSIERMTSSSSNGASEMRKSVSELGKSVEQTKDSTDSFTNSIKKAADSKKGLAIVAGTATGAFLGFGTAVYKTTMQMRFLGGLISNTISGFFSLSKAILMLPFKLLSNIIAMAGNQQGSLALLQAFEEVRKTFGNLATNEAKSLIESFRGAREEANNLAGSGLSIRRIFGTGQEGLAAMMNHLREVATSMGNVFGILQDQFRDYGAELIIFQKGMGLSNEAMRGMGLRALSSGQHLIEVLSNTANLSIQMGEQFGINAKLISRDIGEMANDFTNFGSLAQDELATVSVYARKLGIEIKDLQGLISKFDTFESAAEATSKLAQAFGATADTMALLNTENPAERMDMLRESFFATGRSIEQLTRQERALLAQTTGLENAALEAAFAQENMGMSYEQIAMAAEGAAAAPISTEQAMIRLADSIERVFQQGGSMNSFFDAFFQGFEIGLRYYGPFRDLLRNIRHSLNVTRQAGREFAEMMQDNFPGLAIMLEGLAEAFNPEKFINFFKDINEAFKEFFNSLDPENTNTSVGKFFSNLNTAFITNFGTGGSSILGKIGDGLKAMLNFIGQTIVGMIPGISNAVQTVMQMILALLRGQELPFQDAASGTFSGILSALADAFRGLIPALSDAFSAIYPILTDILKEFFDKIISKIGPYFLAAFSGMLIFNIITAVTGAALKGALAGVSAILGQLLIVKFLKPVQDAVSPGNIGNNAAGGPRGITGGLKDMIDGLASINIGKAFKAGLVLTAMAVGLMVALPLFILSVASAVSIARSNGLLDNPQEAALTMIMAAGAALATLPMIAAGIAIGSIGTAGAGPAAAGLVVAALLIGAGFPAFLYALSFAVTAYENTIAGKERQLFSMIAALAAVSVATILMVGALTALAAAVIVAPLAAIGMAAAGALIYAAADFLVPALGSLAESIGEMFSSFSAGANGAMDAESLSTKIQSFVDILNAMSSITNVMSSITSLKNARPDEVQSTIDSVKGAIIGILESMANTVDRITNIIGTSSLSEEQLRSAQAVGDVISSFADIMSSLSGPILRVEETNRIIGQDTRNVTTYTSIQQIVANLGAFLENMVGDRGHLQAIGRALEVITSLNITEEGLKKVEAVTNFIGSMSSIIESFKVGSGESGEIFATTSQVNAAFANFSTMLLNIERQAPTISSVFSSLERNLSNINMDMITSTIENFEKVVSAINDFKQFINGTEPFDVGVELQNFANGFGVRNPQVTVNREALQLTINLNVTMSANDIAAVLTDRNAVTIGGPLIRANSTMPG